MRVEKDDDAERTNVELQEGNTAISYTQLLMAPPGGFYDEDLI